MADLSPTEGPRWRIHDRTHLEFKVDYAVGDEAKQSEHEWEAYFFIPASLRLDGKTYAKAQIYADLQSYIRFGVPRVPFAEIAGSPLARVEATVARGDSAEIVRELRLFACLVRSAGVAARHSITEAVRSGDHDARSRALAATARMVVDAGRITTGLRAALGGTLADEEDLLTAARWVDEDISRLVETLMGSLAVRLRKAGAPKALLASVTEASVAEARYREGLGLDSVGFVDSTKREVEHLEFRRHVLKRFTASVLWLRPEVREGAKMVLHALYAVAAGVAMMFAVAAALLNGDPRRSETIWIWSAIAVFAYMGKDRIKAGLQGVFSSVVSRHFPDRRWHVQDRERRVKLGKIDEQSGFVSFKDLPDDVLERRRSTRRHPLEEQARPEKVLWHRKLVRLDPEQISKADERFKSLTEIFRLDLRRWLAHTDDPKRKIVFADPHEERVLSAVAPRVYNIGVVYRLRRRGGSDEPWRRIRVVVSRKGIQRIDHIEAAGIPEVAERSITMVP